MTKWYGIALALCLSSCVTVTQSSTTADGTIIKQSVTAIGKTKIEEGLLDYRGVFPTEGGEAVEIMSGTGVQNAQTDVDIVPLLLKLLQGGLLLATQQEMDKPTIAKSVTQPENTPGRSP